jgi:hypothetical protein
VNWPQGVAVAVRAAQAVAGAERVDADTPPMMASEDFGRFLQHLPGAYVFIGNGDGDSPGARAAAQRALRLQRRHRAAGRAVSLPSWCPHDCRLHLPTIDMFLPNPQATRRPYDTDLQAVLNVAAARSARARLATWPLLSDQPTPAWPLPGLAAALGVASITVKDESKRSALGSFKALGAPNAW